MPEAVALLRDSWYMAIPGKRLKRGKTLAKELLGDMVLLGRDKEGKVFAMRNICPHRGIPLSYGKFDGSKIQCCYHGWTFDTTGQCTKIPSLTSKDTFTADRVKVFSYPCIEKYGLVWVFFPKDEKAIPSPLPELPFSIAFGDETQPKIVDPEVFPCNMDFANIGLMDPAHGSYVHKNWWWRTPETAIEKKKTYQPSELGFKMKAHKPASNSRVYRIFGGDLSTSVSFKLPGYRVEHLVAGKKHLYALVTITPLNDKETEVTAIFYSDLKLFTLLLPIFKRFVRKFMFQDYDVVRKQSEGLQTDPPLMLIRDADVLARWYYQLKTEFIAAQEEGREFTNPVSEIDLHYRT